MDDMCRSCGMTIKDSAAYHPYAACLMMKDVNDSELVDETIAAMINLGRACSRQGVSIEIAMLNLRSIVEYGASQPTYRALQSEEPGA